MKFQDKNNPYFGGGKLSMEKYVKKEIGKMEKKMEKDNFEPRYEDHYGIDKLVTYEIIIAGGGPSMIIEIWVRSGEIVGGEYKYGWWGDNENVELSENEAETVANYYGLNIESEGEND